MITTSTTSTTTTLAPAAAATEQPVVSFETTQIYLPADFSTSDIQIVENVAAILPTAKRLHASSDVDLEMAKLMERNPFWWQEGIQNTDGITSTTLSPEELEAKRERRRQRKERKRRRRRKQHKHADDVIEEETVAMSRRRRRREIWNENAYQADNYAEEYVVDPADIEPNIFNENDTRNADEEQERVNTIDVESDVGPAGGEQTGKSVSWWSHFVRHKRKSGKTTGALSRAKAGSSDKGSRSIDRHNKGGK